jgi:cytochrome c
MKRFFFLSLIIGCLSSFAIPIGIEEVIVAMKSGNASAVAKYFDHSVEISMPDKSNSYSKSQAELVLKDFFASNQVKNFEVIHKGENAGSQYCIGTLQTKNGAYRTTIFMKQKGDSQVLQELRFENR